MNTLPIVFCLLFALTIASSSLVEKRMNTKRFIASHNTSQSLRRLFQQAIVKKEAKEMEKEKKASESKEKKNLPNPSSMGKTVGSGEKTEKKNEARRCAKLNLYPLLLLENPEEDPLYQIFINFTVNNYKSASFCRGIDLEKTAKNLLDAILRSAKNLYRKNELILLEKLQLQNPALQKIFYKALKGSAIYQYNNPHTYPKLLEYVTIDSEEYQKICFKHVSKEILSAVYDKASSDKVFEATKEHPNLTKKLLNNILLEDQTTIDEEKLKVFTFSHKNSKKLEKYTFRVTDPLTHVEAETKQYASSSK